MRTVSLDPGGTTGIAIHGVEDIITSHEIEGDDHHKELWDALFELAPDLVIYESFDWRPYRNQKVELISREYIGVIKLYCVTFGVTRQVQKPALKSWWTDNKLKRVGEYKPGKPHANDAVRHLLHYKMQTGDNRWLRELK
jgi:hypothetical protein